MSSKNKRNVFYNSKWDFWFGLFIDIPGKGGVNKMSWSGTIMGQQHSGTIAETLYTDGISSYITQMIDSNSTNYGNIIEKINKSNVEKVKQYTNKIFNDGKRIKIDVETKFDKDKKLTFSFCINSTISVGANAGDIFGDWTEACLYNVTGLQKMSLSFKEYKKI